MPKKIHKIAKALQRKGYSKKSSWKIANSKRKKKK